MKRNKLFFRFTILFFFKNLKNSGSQPNQIQSNGHIPDYDPEFSDRHVYGVHFRGIGVATSEDYGPIPSDDVDEKNRILELGLCRVGSAGGVRVYDLYRNADPETRSTVNGFLCRQGDDWVLIQKTEESKFTRIRWDRILSDADVAALVQPNQEA